MILRCYKCGAGHAVDMRLVKDQTIVCYNCLQQELDAREDQQWVVEVNHEVAAEASQAS